MTSAHIFRECHMVHNGTQMYKKIVYIQTGLNYLPRQRTGWWPVWRPPPPCGDGRSGGTGSSQKSPCWSRQWRLRQKTHRLSRRDYISQFLLSRFLSKTIVLLEIRKWNIASTQRATESTSETGLPVGFGMPWTLRYPLVRYCPFTSMLFWQECLSTLEKNNSENRILNSPK